MFNIHFSAIWVWFSKWTKVPTTLGFEDFRVKCGPSYIKKHTADYICDFPDWNLSRVHMSIWKSFFFGWLVPGFLNQHLKCQGTMWTSHWEFMAIPVYSALQVRRDPGSWWLRIDRSWEAKLKESQELSQTGNYRQGEGWKTKPEAWTMK